MKHKKMQMADNEINKIKRLTTIRRILKISQKEMALKLGIGRPNLSSIENFKDNRRVPRGTSYVLEAEYGINRDWFDTGEGEMLMSGRNNVTSSTNPYAEELPRIYKVSSPMLAETEYNSDKSLSTYKGAQADSEYKYDKKPKTIPYYDVEATAGQLNVFNDSPEVPAYQISIPAFSDCDFAVNVAGNSMYPKFMSGDIIICKELKNMNVISLGDVYLIVTEEQRMVKYLKKSSKDDCFLVTSENPNYEDWDICKEDIKKIYLVKGKIQRNQI